MNLGSVAAAHDSTAFPAYYALISPALRALARGPLRRARHDGGACTSITGAGWCDECEQSIHDSALAGYARLRKAQAGIPPRTRAGDPVRELATVVQWIASPEARHVGLAQTARLLRRPPGEGEPVEVRAARAQLVHYQLQNLEAQVRRAIATSRGASARPDRDLRTSRWATPLREDRVAFELLVGAITRIRNGARDLYAIPADRLGGLTLSDARRMLGDALERLRALRPEFYRANVAIDRGEAGYASAPFQVSEPSPEDLLMQREEDAEARRTLYELLVQEPSTAARHRSLLARICAAESRSDPGLVEWTSREFGYDLTRAQTLVRRHIHLADRAGLDWVTQQCRPCRG